MANREQLQLLTKKLDAVKKIVFEGEVNKSRELRYNTYDLRERMKAKERFTGEEAQAVKLMKASKAFIDTLIKLLKGEKLLPSKLSKEVNERGGSIYKYEVSVNSNVRNKYIHFQIDTTGVNVLEVMVNMNSLSSVYNTKKTTVGAMYKSIIGNIKRFYANQESYI